MEDDPSRRLLLLGGSSGERQPPTVSPCISSIVDLASRHRPLPSSVLLPPFHPMTLCLCSSRGSGFFHYHMPPALTPMAGGVGDGSHHMCSLSDFPFFSMDSFLPAYTRLGGSTVIPLTSSLVGFNQGLPGQPPLWAGHRRLQSDLNVGLSPPNLQMIPLAPVKLEPVTEEHQSKGKNVSIPDNLVGLNMTFYQGSNMLGSSSNANREQIHQLGSQVRIQQEHRPIESTENEANNSMPHHCRNSSAGSSFMTRNLDLGAGSSSHGGNVPIGGDTSALVAANLGDGEFSDADKKTIMASEYLSQLVLSDPKKVKRVLGNRRSAARSKERKVNHRLALESKVLVLQIEINKLSEKLATAQRTFSELLAQNNELKIKIQETARENQMKEAIFKSVGLESLQVVVDGEFVMPNGTHQETVARLIELLEPVPYKVEFGFTFSPVFYCQLVRL
uniref:BZIP domain-containing protein n=1 Tax=Oryza punctata TaxID=4537 RepID=A0A0E0M3I3_ORYPU